MNFSFEIGKTDCHRCRRSRLTTPHGTVETPFFHARGHAGFRQSPHPGSARGNFGAEIILANTYHLYLRPGHELVRKLGGLHQFMSWPRAILTDSGGYQVFSLSELRKITDEGVRFPFPILTAPNISSPRESAEFNWPWVSDIAMSSMNASKPPAPRQKAEAALKRTTEWAKARGRVFSSNKPPTMVIFPNGNSESCKAPPLPICARQSAQQLVELDFQVTPSAASPVGEPHEMTCEMTAESHRASSRQDRPRYLMGVGAPSRSPITSLGIGHDGCVAPHARRRHRLPLHQRRPRAQSRTRATLKTSGPSIRTAPAASAAAIPAAYLRHSSPREKSTAAILAPTKQRPLLP